MKYKVKFVGLRPKGRTRAEAPMKQEDVKEEEGDQNHKEEDELEEVRSMLVPAVSNYCQFFSFFSEFL